METEFFFDINCYYLLNMFVAAMQNFQERKLFCLMIKLSLFLLLLNENKLGFFYFVSY